MEVVAKVGDLPFSPYSELSVDCGAKEERTVRVGGGEEVKERVLVAGGTGGRTTCSYCPHLHSLSLRLHLFSLTEPPTISAQTRLAQPTASFPSSSASASYHFFPSSPSPSPYAATPPIYTAHFPTATSRADECVAQHGGRREVSRKGVFAGVRPHDLAVERELRLMRSWRGRRG